MKKYAKEILGFMKKRLIRSNLKQILYFAISFEIKGQLQVQIEKKNNGHGYSYVYRNYME